MPGSGRAMAECSSATTEVGAASWKRQLLGQAGGALSRNPADFGPTFPLQQQDFAARRQHLVVHPPSPAPSRDTGSTLVNSRMTARTRLPAA